MLKNLCGAQNRCLGRLDYFGHHAFDLLGNLLCNTRFTSGVYLLTVHDLFRVED